MCAFESVCVSGWVSVHGAAHEPFLKVTLKRLSGVIHRWIPRADLTVSEWRLSARVR